MPALSVTQAAAINRLASLLGSVLTNSAIADAAAQFGLGAVGSSKQQRLTSAISQAIITLPPIKQEGLIVSLTMSAHGLHQAGKVRLTDDDVDDIVSELRFLGLRPGELSSKSWRAGLPRRGERSTVAPGAAHQTGPAIVGGAAIPSPRRHEFAIARLSTLAQQNADPQGRGRALEQLVFDVLRAEGLGAERNIVSAGEQLDVAFVVDGQHYLLECKWEHGPIGFATVEHFMARVARKAEGTFGVMLSMSGYVGGINTTASRGQRLNCIGLSYAALVSVTEGRDTWAAIVRESRRLASTRTIFSVDDTTH